MPSIFRRMEAPTLGRGMKARTGMTLVELITAIAIGAVVVATVSLYLFHHYRDTNVAREIENYRAIRTAFNSYVVKKGLPEDRNGNGDILDELIADGFLSDFKRQTGQSGGCGKWVVRSVEDYAGHKGYYIEVDTSSCSDAEKENIYKLYDEVDRRVDDGNPLSGMVRY